MKNFFKLILSIGVCQLAGFVGSVFANGPSHQWYNELQKAPYNPPAWVFGPVWVLLYTLMGIAAFLVWKKGFHRRHVKRALGIFIFQLALNALWSVFFFGAHNPGLAFGCIIALWLAIAWTMILFERFSKAATWLLVPYIAWVSFASYLTYVIWALNR